MTEFRFPPIKVHHSDCSSSRCTCASTANTTQEGETRKALRPNAFEQDLSEVPPSTRSERAPAIVRNAQLRLPVDTPSRGRKDPKDLADPLRPTRFCYDPEFPQSPQKCVEDLDPDVPKPKPFPTNPCGNLCVASKKIFVWGCDDRVQGPIDLDIIRATSPWNHIGKMSTGGTGCLISDEFILTAAHVITSANSKSYKGVKFLPGYLNKTCAFSPRWVVNAWIPKVYANGISGNKSIKSYDWGVMRISTVSTAPPMAINAVPIDEIVASTVYSIGYPQDKSLDGLMGKVMYSTGSKGKVVDVYSGNPPGGLLRTTMDAAGGMSGGPVYIIRNGVRTIVGTMVGAPTCSEGTNWVSLVNSYVLGRINNIIDGNTPSDMIQFDYPSFGPALCSDDGLDF